MAYPFLISIPHGGTGIPGEVDGRLALGDADLIYYSDPATRKIYGFEDSVAALADTSVSRMVVDLNRPPFPLPPRDPDGIVKVRTIDGRPVWREGQYPDPHCIHMLLMQWYFPFHQSIDEMIDHRDVRVAFDCHSMLPVGSQKQKDSGSVRPLFCLGNNGDLRGRARRGSITTCHAEWISALADGFREEFSLMDREVAINNPFSGGFIANAHFWRKGIPWVQIEVNRSLYEFPERRSDERSPLFFDDVLLLREKIWRVLTSCWDQYDGPL